MADPHFVPHLVQQTQTEYRQVPIGSERTAVAPVILLAAGQAALRDAETALPSASPPGIEFDEGSTKHAFAFDIYARPFVPQMLSIINELPGNVVINTPAIKNIDFLKCYAPHIPWLYLPSIPRPIAPPPDPSPQCYSLADSVVHLQYENYFRHHLEAEVKAQKEENRSLSLFDHELFVLYPSNDGEQVTCSLTVPGLQENSPYIEEDDTIQLRQLIYDAAGKPNGMEQWLAAPRGLRHQSNEGGLNNLVAPWVGGRWRGEPAPGWTGTIFNARVVALQRKKKKLIIRVKGLFPYPAQTRPKSFVHINVQFPIPAERRLPMEQVLPIIQESLQFTNEDQVNERLTSENSTELQSVAAKSRHNSWVRSMLFPTEADCELQTLLNPGTFSRSYFDSELNWEQKKSVEIVCCRNYGTLPFLISGPPGTGKTKTLIELAVQLLKGVEGVSRILFCAPSDPAADTIVQRISAHCQSTELLRLNRSSRTFAEVPDAVMRFCFIENDKFDLPPLPQLQSYKIVVTTCRDASLLLYARLTNRDLYAVETGLRKALRPHAKQPSQEPLHWNALLIDEAAQAMEPEALIPISVVAPPLECLQPSFQPLVVMAGDEHQLGPRTSLSSTPLRTSLFARLFARPVYADHPLARGKKGVSPPALNRDMLPISRPPFANLIRNYRSHPAILAVPSALFYNDTLLPEATDIHRLESWSGWCGKHWPVLFRSSIGEDELEEDGGGWYNQNEANIACSYAQELVQSGLVAQKEVCIMAPFKAQVQRLRKTIRNRRYKSLWNIDIGPIEAFQGLERGVVILCTTRSKQRFVEKDRSIDWGIIGLPNKMNVALTRAKFGLIVIGRRDVLNQDKDWNQFLNFCDRNGLVDEGDRPRLGDGEAAGLPTRLEKVLLARERDVENQRVINAATLDDQMCENDSQNDSGSESMDEDVDGYGEYEDEVVSSDGDDGS